MMTNKVLGYLMAENHAFSVDNESHARLES
jgi:hypothetical protein